MCVRQRVDFADFAGLRPGSCSISTSAREASFSDVLGAQLVAQVYPVNLQTKLFFFFFSKFLMNHQKLHPRCLFFLEHSTHVRYSYTYEPI
jgi:hypothetical protein